MTLTSQISAAYIHLLMHAMVMFSSECLGRLDYEATAPAIMMAATMSIFAVDYLAARWMTLKRMRDERENCQNTSAPPSPDASADEKGHNVGHTHDFSAIGAEVMAKDPYSRRAHWEVELLEAGIIFHSIMIGVTLGAQGGSTFVSCGS